MRDIDREKIPERLENMADYYEGKLDDSDHHIRIIRSDAELLREAAGLIEREIRGDGAADLIKRAMEKEGVNQIILAEKTGITRQNVSQMLNRGKNCMRYDSFEKLAKALGYEVILSKN